MGPQAVDGKPNPAAFRKFFNEHLQIKGRFQMASNSQVSGAGLLILHFLLKGMDSAGSPAKILLEYMSNFVNKSYLHYEEIFFDISTPNKIEAHAHKMLKLGQVL
jgi:hypothetical protein